MSEYLPPGKTLADYDDGPCVDWRRGFYIEQSKCALGLLCDRPGDDEKNWGTLAKQGVTYQMLVRNAPTEFFYAFSSKWMVDPLVTGYCQPQKAEHTDRLCKFLMATRKEKAIKRHFEIIRPDAIVKIGAKKFAPHPLVAKDNIDEYDLKVICDGKEYYYEVKSTQIQWNNIYEYKFGPGKDFLWAVSHQHFIKKSNATAWIWLNKNMTKAASINRNDILVEDQALYDHRKKNGDIAQEVWFYAHRDMWKETTLRRK